MKYLHHLRPAIIKLSVVGLGAVAPAAFVWPQIDPGHDAQLSPTEFVDRYAAEIKDLTAIFEQNVYDIDGALVEASTGQFLMLRPNRFVWHQETPYELRIVADGEKLWMYDVDIEQVTRAPLSDLANSPAMVLSGEGRVSDSFVLNDIESDDGRRWIELEPFDEGGDFDSARIAFLDGVPTVLEFIDGLSQLTRIEFRDIDINEGLRARDFRFDPPAGVDIVGEDD